MYTDEIIFNKLKANNLDINADFLSYIFRLIPSSTNNSFNLNLYNTIKDYIPNIKAYLLKPEVIDMVINDIDKSGFVFRKLWVILEDDISVYFNDENIIKLYKRDRIKTYLYSDIKIKDFCKINNILNYLFPDELTTKQFDEIFNLLHNIYEIKEISYLLKVSLKENKYETFYKLFKNFTSEEQIIWINDNKELFLSIIKASPYILKGIKKDAYRLYNQYIDDEIYTLDIDEIKRIITKDSTEYSRKQITRILTNKTNFEMIKKDVHFGFYIPFIINLNLNEVNDLYLKQDMFDYIIENNKVNEFYSFSEKIEVYHDEVFYNEKLLKIIGEETLTDDSWYDNLGPFVTRTYYYSSYFYGLTKSNNKETIFKVLDFYLTNHQYLSSYHIILKLLYSNEIDEYYESREELITKVINTSESKYLYYLFSDLKPEQIKKYFTKDRERIIPYLNSETFVKIFHNAFRNNYKINIYDFSVNDIVKVFADFNYIYLEEKIGYLIKNKIYVEQIMARLKLLESMKEGILKKLNDSRSNFIEYYKIIFKSSFYKSLDQKFITFIEDMLTIIFGRDYDEIIDLYDKYRKMDLEDIKLSILNIIEDNSKKDIINSLTDINSLNYLIEKYNLNDDLVDIKTYYLDGEAYNLLVRTVTDPEYYYGEYDEEQDECYSVIYENNRCLFYGDRRIICGFNDIDPESINYIFPFDAITQNLSEHKYSPKGLKSPLWLSMKDLNKYSKNRGCYNELRIVGSRKPSYLVSYDEPKEKTIDFAYKHDLPIVKVLRKSYPDAIECFEDPYSHWQ